MNKYIFYDTAITSEGKKRYLPGVSLVRYGNFYFTLQLWAQKRGEKSQQVWSD